MGTALTGLEIKDTYEGLVKTTDNGPLSGTLKALSDGLGNDSTLSLSTTAASIAGTLAVTGNAAFDTNTLFVDAAANEVGIGTITPNAVLNVIGEISQADFSTATNSIFSQRSSGSVFTITTTGTTAAQGTDISFGWANGGQGPLTFTRAAGEVMRLDPSGNVGIGTSTPAVKLDVVGNIRSSTGILFGADTAAANLLDDYEEGTWTIGVAFGGAAVGVTTSSNTGTYTKIGRQVTVNGYLFLTSKGSSSGIAKITGLPFTIANTNGNLATTSLFFQNITFANQFQGYGVANTQQISLEEITTLGATSTLTNADFADNSGVIVNLTYFV